MTRTRGGLSTILGTVLMYLVLIGVAISFSSQILETLGSTTNRSPPIITIILGISFPLIILIAIGIQIIRLIGQFRSGAPGIYFKARIILLVSALTLVSTIPQAILFSTYLEGVVKTELIQQTKRALETASSLATERQDELQREFISFGKPEVRKLWLSAEQLGASWERLQSFINPPEFLEISDRNGNLIKTFGNKPEGLGEWSFVNTREFDLLYRQAENQTIASYFFTTENDWHFLLGRFVSKDLAQSISSVSKARVDFGNLVDGEGGITRNLSLVYVTFLLPLILLSLLSGFFLSSEIVRPLINLDASIRRIARGDFNTRLAGKPNDETNFLVHSFNRMVQELNRNRQVLKSNERLEAWQEIAQRMAHEIKNPLTPIKLSAQRLQKHFQEGRPDFEKTLDTSVKIIVEEVENLTHLLSEFSNFARMPQSIKKPINLKALVEEISHLYLDAKNKELTIDYSLISEGEIITADRMQMSQVFKNIFQNSIDAMQGRGKISIESDLVEKDRDLLNRIIIRDTGPGISKEDVQKVFKPYMTTKKTGTGLGLAIVEKILLDHEGEIWCEFTNGAGACFVMELPHEHDELSNS